MSYYFLYFLGAFLALLFKYISYVRYGKYKRKGRIFKRTLEWFFEPSLSNAVSWLATIGLVWVGGVIYVERLEVPFLNSLPLNAAFAFFLGIVMEYVAPVVMKTISKFIENLANK